VSFALLHALVSNGNLRFAAPLYPLFAVLAAGGTEWAIVFGTGRRDPGAPPSRPPV
jgi:hypothetical protein